MQNTIFRTIMKIFIINLARATDRKDFMKTQIEKINHPDMEFLFFDAIDAKNGEHHRFDSYYRSFFTRLYRAKDSTDGERACYASHFSLWQKCIELNEPIVVLEDDIELLPEFLEGICRISDSSYEYVRLMGLDEPKNPLLFQSDYFALTYDELAGTQGYYLTPKAAKKFIKGCRYWVLAVDNYMDRISMHGVRTILHIPYLIKDNEFISANTTIHHRYDEVKKSILSKSLREVYRLFIQIKQKLYIFIDRRSL